MKTKGIMAVLAAGLATALFATSPSVTWYVDSSASAGGSGLSSESAFPTIAEAVALAASGDTIQIAAGVYAENVVVEGKSLTIIGAGRDATVIDANGSGRPLYLKGAAVTGTRVKSLCLANGRADEGAGLYVDDAGVDVGFLDGKITDCVSTGNGAAVNGPAWVVRSLIGRCWSSGSGKAVFTGAKGLFSCVIIGCGRKVSASWDDADISQIVDSYDSGDQIKVVNCTFCNNEGRLVRWNSAQALNIVIKNCAFFGVHEKWVRTGMIVDYCFSSRGGVLTPSRHNIGEDTIPSTTPYQVVAPFSDWRPLAGSDLIDSGKSAFVSDLVPEEYRGTDYYGNTRIQGGAVDIGAAEGAVSAAGGIVFFRLGSTWQAFACATNLWINGYRVVSADNQMLTGPTMTIANGIHFASTEANRTASMTFRYFDDRSLALWGVTGVVANVATVWHPNQKGTFTFVLPSSGIVSNSLIKAASIKWVSPDGNDSSAGTKAAPLRTLVQANYASSAYGVVFAKRGLYAEGRAWGPSDGDNVNTTSNRVYINKRLLLTSVDGAEATIIKGNRATGEGTYDGCGAGALRCVQAQGDTPICVCGFTLTGGATDANPIAQQKTGKTGNAATRGNFGGSAAQGHTWNCAKESLQLVDCIISNNVSYFGTVYSAVAKNCVFTDNRIVNTDSSGTTVSAAIGVMGYGLKAFGCLAYGNPSGWRWISEGQCYDSTLAGTPGTIGTCRNTAYFGSSAPSGGGITAARNDFADADNGDWRPVPGSSLLTGGTAVATSTYARFGTSSMDGIGYEPGSGLGLVVGAYRGASEYPDTRTDWYVDAAKADDSGDGLTPATAKKTLAAVMALVRRGDTVHAAPGTYDEGEMTNRVNLIYATDTNLFGSRVVIPDGVSLVSDEGPDVTFIKGRRGSDFYNLGWEALRGVYMEENTLLEGFTVMTCSTSSGSGLHEYNCGGCVVAPKANVARPGVIRNCRLTGGHARSGAAAFGGVLERCRIDNCTLSSGGVTYYAKLYNCLLDNTTKGNVSLLHQYYGVYNSTIYVDNVTGDPDFLRAETGAPIENTILFYKKFTAATTLRNAKNCIICSSRSGLTIDSSCSNLIEVATLGEVVDTGTYRPVANSAAIDAGDMTLFAAHPSTLDFGGGQRVYSGTVDIGAYEYVPFAEMGSALAKRNIAVTEADGDASVSGGDVLLTKGTLEVVWDKKSDSTESVISFEVTGGGVLVVRDETGVLGRYTANGVETLRWNPTGTGNKSISFAYQPAVGDASDTGVVIKEIYNRPGFLLIYR